MRRRRAFHVLFLIVTTAVAIGQEPNPTSWKETGVQNAPEAIQAAAADETYLYVIDSRRIAKYDRKTGRRLAESIGEAQHLNSGFLHEGALYCAHSNFPKTPEQSEIFVLDPASMRLRSFKEFGNYGGSLTWVVRHDDAWWCNFARYGDDNGETFLVQFDDEWRELRRWTYPPEVLRELGRYSLSGGLWRDDVLLVTGHDDPVVFRLRLPAEGTVLEFDGTAAVPFYGQGFAQDPATDGLVGIRRSKRQVVFASPIESSAP